MAVTKRLTAEQRRYVEAIAEFSQEEPATVRRLFFRPGSGHPGSRIEERRAINQIGKAARLASKQNPGTNETDRLTLLFDAQVFAFERRHGEPFKKPRKPRA